MGSGHGAATAVAIQHPRRRLLPFGGQPFRRVVTADQGRSEREQSGGGQDGEEHRGRHPHPFP